MKPTTTLAVLTVLSSVCQAQIAGSFDVSGTGCPKASLLYEQFSPGTFDLTNTSRDWFPNGGQGYVVATGAVGFLPIAGGQAITPPINSVSAPQNLGFSFPYPGGVGSTMFVEVSYNGYLYLEPGTIPLPRCCNGDGAVFTGFLRDTPSWAVLGMQFDSGNIWFNTGPGVAYFTWEQMTEPGQILTTTFQIQLFNDGRVTLAWNNATVASRTALVGWSAGNNVFDCGPTDFSAPVIDMGSSSGPLTLGAPPAHLPTTGQTFQIDITNVASDAVLGALLLGVPQVQFDLDALGMPDCDLLALDNIGTAPLTLTPPTGLISFPLPTTPGTAGLEIFVQAVVIAPSVNPFGLATSNRGRVSIGDFNPVVVEARGPNCLNDDELSGFWRVINASPLDIVSMRLSWIGSSIPSPRVFDTNQNMMNDRFDGSGSTFPLCHGTYRNGSDAIVGLDYPSSSISACTGGPGRTGWVGSVAGINAGDFRTLDFQFTDFNPGEIFEFDADVEGASSKKGSAMEGLVVTITRVGGVVSIGELVMIDANTARVAL